MYINLYKSNCDFSVVIPVLLYKISAKIKNEENNLDIIGETILKVIEIGQELDIDYIVKLIGIPYKYRKLIECELNELIDSRRLNIDDNNIITEINCKTEEYIEYYYVIFDRINKKLLDCIIREKEFEKIHMVRKDLIEDKSHFIDKKNRFYPDKYNISSQINNLIKRSNELENIEEEVGKNEQDSFLRPFYCIELDTVGLMSISWTQKVELFLSCIPS